MNYRKYISIFLGAALIMAGCEKPEEIGSQNKGKTRPSATLAAEEAGAFEYSFTVKASDNASQYAIVVFKGKDNTEPSAYDIVVKEVSGTLYAKAYNVADNAEATVTLECEPDSDYQIFAAAITETGLLSKVSSVTIHTKEKVAPVSGDYKISYAALGDNVINPKSGEAFEAYFEQLTEEYVIMQANWFNYYPAGYVLMPYLLGTIDYKSQTITFDGTYCNGNLEIAGNSAFGSAFYYFNQARTMFLVFWGGGNSGQEPVIVEYDDNGYLTTISYCDYTIHDAGTGAPLAVYDALTDGTLTYVPEKEENIVSMQAPNALPTALECSVGGFCK